MLTNWFKKWSLFHYNEANDCGICHTCMSATTNKMLRFNNADLAFEVLYPVITMHIASYIHLLTYEFYTDNQSYEPIKHLCILRRSLIFFIL